AATAATRGGVVDARLRGHAAVARAAAQRVDRVAGAGARQVAAGPGEAGRGAERAHAAVGVDGGLLDAGQDAPRHRALAADHVEGVVRGLGVEVLAGVGDGGGAGLPGLQAAVGVDAGVVDAVGDVAVVEARRHVEVAVVDRPRRDDAAPGLGE